MNHLQWWGAAILGSLHFEESEKTCDKNKEIGER